MTWSLGEIRALSMKAARGAELEWGQAEELSYSIVWLEQRGVSAVALLAQYLNWREKIDAEDQDFDPVLLASEVSDLGSWESSFPTSVLYPLLVIPSIASVLDDEVLEVTWSDATLYVSRASLLVENLPKDFPAKAVEMRLEKSSREVPQQKLLTRFFGDGENHPDILQGFAQRTYAPSSENSRAGAGAGDDGNE